MRDRGSFVLASFEAYLSEATFMTCLPSKTGRSVPVEQGKIVPGILDTEQPVCYYTEVGSGKEQKHRIRVR